MQDPFIYRSLLFAVIEFGLAAWVISKGKTHRYLFSLVLFFLASYQLGEFLFLRYDSYAALQFAAFSTTLLPPLGLLIVTKRGEAKRIIAWAFLALGLIFSINFLINPELFYGTKHTFCLVKFFMSESGQDIMIAWGIYYIIGLGLAMLITLFNYLEAKRKNLRKYYLLLFIAYLSFFPTSYVVTFLFKLDTSLLTSLMCSLAIIAAGIMATESIYFQFYHKKK